MQTIWLISVFVVATCGLIYELVAGALASYLLGDSVTQFSTVIGVYLFSMGIGSYLSKYLKSSIVSAFIRIEILIGLVGGSSAALLFLSFEYVTSFRLILYSTVFVTGMLVGVEIPLLLRILKDRYEFKDLVSHVFTFDYIGALAASLIFPLFLIPHLGFIRTSFMFGIINVVVALWAIHLWAEKDRAVLWLRRFAILSAIYLVFGFVYSEELLRFAEVAAYHEKIIYAKSTPYQRIVITQKDNELRLFLNGNLQFSSLDEYRYHEALVHVGLSQLPQASEVLILGGGDGLAVREVLKYPQIRKITLVDLDVEMTRIFREFTLLKNLNQNSLESEKVEVLNADAFSWLRENSDRKFDFVIIDFPDPSNFSLGKLYSTAFYKNLKKNLKDDGLIVVQSTSPFVAKKTFWCVVNTLEDSGFSTLPYHAYVPSFGDWGYILAHKSESYSQEKDQMIQSGVSVHLPKDLRYISKAEFNHLFHFPIDMKSDVKDINRLNNQALVHHFENEWGEYQN